MWGQPIYNFDDETSTGIYDIPLDHLVYITDFNGSPKQVIKLGNGSLIASSTIQDFINQGALWDEVSSGSSLSSTDDLNEGSTNLYYTNSRVDARIGQGISNTLIGDLQDVSTVGATAGYVLKFDGSHWRPAIDEVGSGSGGAAQYLDQLADVDLQTNPPVIGNALTFTGSEWEPQETVQGTGDLTDIDYNGGAPTIGDILTFDGTNWSPDYNVRSTDDLVDIDYSGNIPSTGDILTFDGTNWSPDYNVRSTDDLVDIDYSGNIPSTGDILTFDGTNWSPEYNVRATGDLTDIDYNSGAPITGDMLAFDGNNWVPTDRVTSLYDLSDVQAGTPHVGWMLGWQGTTWIPIAPQEYELDDLTDVDFTTNPPVDKGLLQYNSSTNIWETGKDVPNLMSKAQTTSTYGNNISSINGGKVHFERAALVELTYNSAYEMIANIDFFYGNTATAPNAVTVTLTGDLPAPGGNVNDCSKVVLRLVNNTMGSVEVQAWTNGLWLATDDPFRVCLTAIYGYNA